MINILSNYLIKPNMYIFLLVFLICGSVCAEPKKIPVVIDNSFNKIEINEIQKALLYWKNKTQFNIKINVKNVSKDLNSWHCDKTITIYNAYIGWKRKVFDYYYPRTNDVLAFEHNDTGDIFLKHKGVFKLTIHEFGHALGLKHSNNKDNVMYYIHLHGPIFISKEDIKFVKQINKEY